MDRSVEKMHVKELKEILFRKKVSLKEVSSVSNPLFYMIKYTWKLCNAPLTFVSLFFCKWLQV